MFQRVYALQIVSARQSLRVQRRLVERELRRQSESPVLAELCLRRVHLVDGRLTDQRAAAAAALRAPVTLAPRCSTRVAVSKWRQKEQ